MEKEKDTREKILQAAKNLFAKKGKNDATIEEIADLAGIGKGTIYNYFDSKEEIFSEIIHQEGMQLFDQIDKSVRKERDVRSKLRAYVITKVSTIKKLINLYEISKERFLDLSKEVEYERDVIYERERLLVEEILKSGIMKGEIEIKNPELLSAVIISALKDIEFRWITEEPIENIKRYLDALLDILFFGMAKRSDSIGDNK